MSDIAQVLDPTQRVAGLRDSVLDFWRWGFSDYSRSMELQAVVGKFLVATALGIQDEPRRTAGEAHLHYEGHAIATSATRSWRDGRRPGQSGPLFSAPPPRRWDDARNEAVAFGRTADCYVFCLLNTPSPEPETATVLSVAAWRFWAVPTPLLERDLGDERRLGDAWLDERGNAVGHADLREAVDAALEAD